MLTVNGLRTLGIQATSMYLKALQSVTNPIWKEIAQEISNPTGLMEAPIAHAVGPLREWNGGRVIERVKRDSTILKSKLFEKTVAMDVDKLHDDNLGVYNASFQTIGMQAAAWPDQQVLTKLERGETDLCYDGKAFFADDHPIDPGNADSDTFDNFATGAQPPWYLFDVSKPIKPMIWGVTLAPQFTNRWSPDDPHVFDHNELLSGVKARGAAEFGLPHLAYKSKLTLNATNFDAAVAAMEAAKAPNGESLDVKATLLVVPRVLKQTARKLFGQDNLASGESNIHKDAIRWISSSRLSDT